MIERDPKAPPGQADRRRAVVIGASMAGLCAARALADEFERVTVLDRDQLPPHPTSRRGVPQGRHVHVLLPAGVQALASLFPGLLGEMAAAGALTVPTEQVRVCLNGRRLARARTGLAELGASRPLIETHVRDRVRAHPAVELLDGVDTHGLEADPTGRRILGVRTRARSNGGQESTLTADLVVDCSGRRSRTPTWLAKLGYAAPPVEQLDIDVHYATRHYRLPTGTLGGDRHILIGPTPDGPTGGVLLAIEGDRWVATLFGMCDTRPSLDPGTFEAFAAQLPMSDLADALREGEPLDEPTGFRFPADLRRRYDQLDAFPTGLLVAGDAVCSFNPIYGQGMTVAAVQAKTLRRLLSDDDAVPEASRWFAAIAPTIDTAWQLAVGADLAVRCVPGRRPPTGRLQRSYIRSIHAAARHDPVLTARFWRVAGLIDPPTALLRPTVIARVLRGRLRRRRSAHAREVDADGTRPRRS